MRTHLSRSLYHLLPPLLVHVAFAYPDAVDWLAAVRKVLGPGAPAMWVLDLADEEAELSAHGDIALVVVHRGGSAAPDDRRALHHPIVAPGSTRLLPVAAPDTVDGTWLHAVHTGQLQGVPVTMDQFLSIAPDTPPTRVRVIVPHRASRTGGVDVLALLHMYSASAHDR
jgi:hypothetical protein